MQTPPSIDRRMFMNTSLVAALVCPLIRAPLALAENEDVSALEDLMREHGALNRVLLIYEEADRRIGSRADFLPASLHQAANIIRKFIENYHEKLEEEFVFPVLDKAQKFAGLSRTLKEQHDAGRKITSEILSLTSGTPPADVSAKLHPLLSDFIRMYRPHEAFEDTIAFPEFKRLIPKKEYDKLGRVFEEREHKQLGKEGFEGVLVQVTEIEKSFGIHDLKQFTPKIRESHG